MGCGGSREKETGLHAPMEHTMTNIGIEDIDQFFKDASDLIKTAEEMRELIVDNMDKLVVSSGACAYKDPLLRDCTMGICWKISADNQGKFVEGAFKVDSNFKVSMEGKNNSPEVSKACQELNTYFTELLEAEEKVTMLSAKGEDLLKNIKEKGGEMTGKVNEHFRSEILSLPKKLRDIAKNVSLVTTACTNISKLSTFFVNNIAFIKELSSILNDAEKIDAVGKKAYESKKVKAYEIVWNQIKETSKREGKKPEDGLHFWNERIKRKAARKASLNK